MERIILSAAGVFLTVSAFGWLPPSRAADPQLIYIPGTMAAVGDAAMPPGIEDQVRLTLENLRSQLQAQGVGLERVVSVNVYLSDSRNFAAMNDVYQTFFRTDPPTRATVEADLPRPDALVQISAVALRSGVSKEVITPQGMARPGLPYSWGIRAGSVLFIAGTTSRDPTTYEPVTGDVGTQTRRVLGNVGNVLRAAGMGYEDVVSCRVYLAEARDFRAMNEVYRTFFTSAPPARATVRSRLMNPAFNVEIQCVASDADDRRVVSVGEPSPNSPLSPGIASGGRVFLSGMLGRGPDGYSSNPAEQTRLTLENLLETFQAASLDFSNVVEATVYVTDVRQARAVMEEYGNSGPAASIPVTVVGSPLMSATASVEISMTAVP
jgi:2-iminobutanoate/2-iminopropanoate deaminase